MKFILNLIKISLKYGRFNIRIYEIILGYIIYNYIIQGGIMFDLSIFKEMSQKEKYENMLLMLKGILEGEEDVVTNLSNSTALINALIEDISWCGFYIIKNEELVLGPFQGLPACTRIKIGKGVCGTAAKEKETILVKDVNSFEGHIACDAASNSEIVIPIIKDEKVYGVLDIDSTSIARFHEEDKIYLEKAVDIINSYVDWNKISY